ncbi:glycosyltransferase family 4 protein [Candidatus Pantoea floridensis]|uniref:Glycosyltransferase involved in cell wall bisynthesis n=1 Tax=Candidatus Pantoea floridensis TaxID=1938870 RepID=A0A286BXK0_9GAMM|nr:glycosyltransferase family 4 protein [Pantoea floridensis]PIF21348.1 glycosyltransferase involved in cell wall biosynthesis [Enterobacteriaceae bacterium JKS000233]SOD38860.1 Glycosyltransferase involved in cell wall bisynthesis [Pantoea floridensis]
MKSILFLSTYPFSKPRHGGQIRLHQLVKKFERNGWTTRSIAVYEQESYLGDELGAYDVPFPVDSKYRMYKGKYVPLINDLLTGQFAISEDDGLDKIIANLPPQIDIIHVEQCWLWPLVGKIKSLPKYKNVIVVFGSQNIEYILKDEILEQYHVNDRDDVIQDIKALELKAVLEADIVAAVTECDVEFMREWHRREIKLAANGIEPWESNILTDKWEKRLPKAPWLLYIASAHPPNFTSFNKIIGESLACIPPDSKLVIAGSVCEHIYKEVLKSKWASINMSRLEFLYVLDDADLAEVKNRAYAYFLPIEHGGGSNLKTAEALYSGKPIIGTISSFRGFEKYSDSPRVNVIRTPEEFFEVTRKVLSNPQPVLEQQERVNLENLTWDKTLDKLYSDVQNYYEASVNA